MSVFHKKQKNFYVVGCTCQPLPWVNLQTCSIWLKGNLRWFLPVSESTTETSLYQKMQVKQGNKKAVLQDTKKHFKTLSALKWADGQSLGATDRKWKQEVAFSKHSFPGEHFKYRYSSRILSQYFWGMLPGHIPADAEGKLQARSKIHSDNNVKI